MSLRFPEFGETPLSFTSMAMREAADIMRRYLAPNAWLHVEVDETALTQRITVKGEPDSKPFVLIRYRRPDQDDSEVPPYTIEVSA